MMQCCSYRREAQVSKLSINRGGSYVVYDAPLESMSGACFRWRVARSSNQRAGGKTKLLYQRKIVAGIGWCFDHS